MDMDFYTKAEAEKILGGPEEYRAEVYDDSPEYEVDIHDIGKYGGKWFAIRATGCSCWGGEYSREAGPFDTLDELRDYILGEYGKVETAYYQPLLDAWSVAIEEAAKVA